MWTILDHQLINLDHVQRIEIVKNYEDNNIGRLILHFSGCSKEECYFTYTSDATSVEFEYQRLVRLLINKIK